MPNLNKIVADSSNLRKKVLKDLKKLQDIYAMFSSEVNDRFRREYKEAGSLKGLEDFYSFNNTVKKNMNSVRNAVMLLSHMKDVEKYRIEEIEEKLLEEIFE